MYAIKSINNIKESDLNEFLEEFNVIQCLKDHQKHPNILYIKGIYSWIESNNKVYKAYIVSELCQSNLE